MILVTDPFPEVNPMTQQTGFLSRIRIRILRSSTATKVAIVCAVVLSTVTLAALHGILQQTLEQTEALRQQAAQLEQENAELKDKIDDLGSVDSVEDIAKEELGLVDPDTVIIEPQQ